jgi:heme/copper-type cytochrome/quinol oxidase subunit 1
MLLRVLERLVALLFWVALTAVAFLIATQRTLDVMGRPEQLVDTDALLQSVAAFDATSALAIAVAVGLVLLGLAVLVMEFTPRRPRSLLHQAGERVTFTLDRRGLERRLTRTAESDSEVDEAKVRIRRRAKVKLQMVEGSDKKALRRRTRDRLREEVDQLVEKKTPTVKVDATSGGGRVR